MNGSSDIFVHDRKSGATTRVSVDSTGAQATGGDSSRPALSGNGRFVAFESVATDLVPGDTNGASDSFVHDRKSGLTSHESVAAPEGQATGGSSSNPALSGNGRFVAFESDAPDLVPDDSNGLSDIFVHDRKSGTTTRVSVDAAGAEASNHSFVPALSANGRFVAFESGATNLVPLDTNGRFDVFVRDRK